MRGGEFTAAGPLRIAGHRIDRVQPDHGARAGGVDHLSAAQVDPDVIDRRVPARGVGVEDQVTRRLSALVPRLGGDPLSGTGLGGCGARQLDAGLGVRVQGQPRAVEAGDVGAALPAWRAADPRAGPVRAAAAPGVGDAPLGERRLEDGADLPWTRSSGPGLGGRRVLVDPAQHVRHVLAGVVVLQDRAPRAGTASSGRGRFRTGRRRRRGAASSALCGSAVLSPFASFPIPSQVEGRNWKGPTARSPLAVPSHLPLSVSGKAVVLPPAPEPLRSTP